MDANASDSTALHDYVSALLQCTGALMLIVNHMADAAVAAPPDGDDVPTVLARLIEGILAPALALDASGLRLRSSSGPAS